MCLTRQNSSHAVTSMRSFGSSAGDPTSTDALSRMDRV
jgi:hypothetical protein